MKQTLLILLSCAFSTGLLAQIEVTNSTFPNLGDTLFTVTTFGQAGISLGDTGAEVTWDFSTLADGNDNEIIYQDAADGSAFDELPNADLLNISTAGEAYYQVTDTEFLTLAGKGEDPTGFGVEALVRFMPPIVERRAPMNFGDVNTSESDASFAFSSDVVPDSLLENIPFAIDSIRIRINQTRTDVVDAFGMVTIPGGTFEVLREKRTQVRSTRVDVLSFLGWTDVTDIIAGLVGVNAGLGEVSTVNYLYFNDEEKEIIAKLDRTQLIRVITNLVKNAIQAVPEVASPRILVSMASEYDYVKIMVADNGIGISDENRDKIFEPKFTTKTSGMGLGLGMVKNIVESYKGTIDYTSQPGKGTVFTVKFPKEI